MDKLLNRYYSLFQEKKNFVYHTTSLYGLQRILDEGKIVPRKGFISFSLKPLKDAVISGNEAIIKVPLSALKNWTIVEYTLPWMKKNIDIAEYICNCPLSTDEEIKELIKDTQHEQEVVTDSPVFITDFADIIYSNPRKIKITR